jgi:hypothetical protein
MSTVPQQQNIVFEQGTPFSLVYTWTDSNGNPINLTGYSARLHVATDLTNKTSIILFTTGTGATAGTSLTLGGSSGVVTATATDVATTAMTFQTAVYALFVQSPGGVTTKLLEGDVVVNAGLSW